MLLSGHLQAADTKILVLLRESFTLIFFLPVTLFPRGLGSFNIPVMQFVQILSPLRRKRHFPINTMYWVLHWTLTNVWSAPVLTVQWSCPCYIGHCQMSQVPLYLQSSGAAPVPTIGWQSQLVWFLRNYCRSQWPAVWGVGLQPLASWDHNFWLKFTVE